MKINDSAQGTGVELNEFGPQDKDRPNNNVEEKF